MPGEPAHKVVDGDTTSSDEITSDDTTRPEPDADVMGELHGAFGVEPEYAGYSRIMDCHEYRVPLVCVELALYLEQGSWEVEVYAKHAERLMYDEEYDTLSAAIDAAKEAGRELLDETMEVLT